MDQNITELQKKQFFDDGYIILKDFFSHEELQKIETAFVRMYAIQASKILEYRKKLHNGINFLDNNFTTLIVNFILKRHT